MSTLGEVFESKRQVATPAPRRSFLVGSLQQDRCHRCRETITQLEHASKVKDMAMLQLKNKLINTRKELETAKRKHSEINNEIIRSNVSLLTAVQDWQAQVRHLTTERDEALHQANILLTENTKLKAETTTINRTNVSLLEILRTRPLGNDPRDPKKRRIQPTSSPLLVNLPRSSVFSPATAGGYTITSSDLMETMKSSDTSHSSLSARFQPPLRESGPRTNQTPEPLVPAPEIPQLGVDDGDGDEDAQDDIHSWQQSWAGYFDDENNNEDGDQVVQEADDEPDSTMERKRKRVSLLREGAPKRARQARELEEDSSDSDASRTPVRPSRSAKTKITSLREPSVGGKLRAGYPGTFDHRGTVPYWRQRSSMATSTPKTPRKTPKRSYATSGSDTEEQFSRYDLVPRTPIRRDSTIATTPYPRKRSTPDAEVEEEDGFRYYAKSAAAPLSGKSKRLGPRQPSVWDTTA